MANKRKREYIARVFVSATGRWYITPDKNGRFVIPKAFSPMDPKNGYKFDRISENTILLTPNKYYNVLRQLCIPSAIRSSMNVSGGKDVFCITSCEDGKFTLTLCKGDEII